MQGKSKKGMLLPETVQYQRKKKLRNWAILLAITALVAGGIFLLRNIRKPTGISVQSLPCFAHQDVTIFRDGVLYYDGSSIHFISANGTIGWSYPVGEGASFSVSDTHMVVWSGSQLMIVDARGKPSYSEAMEEPIQFARIGSRYAVVVTGEDTKPSVIVKDLQGTQVDKEIDNYDGMLVLDCGFYGNRDEYLWTLALDIYNPAISTIMNTFQVGLMNTGVVYLGENLAYKVVYENNKLRVFTTQQMYTYDYKGVQDTTSTKLVYGWQLIGCAPMERGSALMLMAPTAQTSSAQSITELRVMSDTLDRRYTLPSACVGAVIEGERLYAFSADYLYAGNVSSQRFYAHAVDLPDERTVSSLIGITNNGYAVVTSGTEVFSVTLPR